MALEGVRIAWSEEAPPNFVIDEPMLKSLTSSGIKAARQVYEKQKQLKLICSFVIESNGTFTFDIDDEWSRDAALERTRVMKFVNQVPATERDPEVLKRITSDEAELTAALGWVIQGYFDRRDFGLETPATIDKTKEEFQVVINPLSTFVKNEIEFDDGMHNDDGTEKEPSDYDEVSVSVADLWQRFQETSSADVLKSFKGSRSFNVQLKKVLPYYAKLAGVDGVKPHKRKTGAIWINTHLVNREDFIDDPDEEQAHERVTQTVKGDAKGANGVKSSCTGEYYYTLHQNGVLRHPPTFPTLLVNGLEPLELDFSTIEEHSDEIKKGDAKLSEVEHSQTEALKDSGPMPSRDTSELAQHIRDTLIAARDAGRRIGPVDVLDKEQLAKATTLKVKQQHPEWRDYDVESFYKRLAENDKGIQGLIADLTGG
jgi:hypothetical protein